MKSNTQIKAIDQKRNTTTVANKISKNFRAKAEPKPPVSFVAFVNNSTKQNPKTNTTFVFFPFFHSVEDSVSIEWLLFVCLFFRFDVRAEYFKEWRLVFVFTEFFCCCFFFVVYGKKVLDRHPIRTLGLLPSFFFYRIFAPT